MEFSNERILTTVKRMLEYAKKIQHLSRPQYRKELIDSFPDFFEHQSGLFNMIADDPFHFDYQRLTYMLALRNEIKNGNTSHEDASKRLGQEYYDEFVDPVINK